MTEVRPDAKGGARAAKRVRTRAATATATAAAPPPPSGFLLGGDPGTTHFGMAIAEVRGRRAVLHGCALLKMDPAVVRSATAFMRRMHAKYPLRLLAVERQGQPLSALRGGGGGGGWCRPTMLQQEVALCAAADMLRVPYMQVSNCSMRAIAGSGGASRGASKSAAVGWLHALLREQRAAAAATAFEAQLRRHALGKQDHIADAALCISTALSIRARGKTDPLMWASRAELLRADTPFARSVWWSAERAALRRQQAALRQRLHVPDDSFDSKSDSDSDRHSDSDSD